MKVKHGKRMGNMLLKEEGLKALWI